MKILTISSLYPNNRDLKHGIFVETRLRHLRQHYPDVEAVVIAPVPWFPLNWKIFGEYARFAGVAHMETRHGVTIYHPRYLVLPKIGMQVTPWFMARSIKKVIHSLVRKGHQFDLIDGHYFYPDGVAIAAAAADFDLPFTCTARGTDINLIPTNKKALAKIKKVFRQAGHLMAVCKALADEMISLGADVNKVTVLRNGVDLDLFGFVNEEQQLKLREKHAVPANQKLIVSCGWLIERKGHHFVIEALTHLPDVHLVIAGDGPDLDQLKSLAVSLGVENRVKFAGALPQTELKELYGMANALVLASSREGWANVLLESMATGTPVVATNIWGTPEVVASPAAGLLCERTADDIASKLKELLDNSTKRELTRVYAEQFTWQQTSDGQYEIFKKLKGFTR